MDASLIGETFGSYRLLRQLGKGGMGAVYLGEHVLMSRRAAVKILSPAFCRQPTLVARFFNEARASARLCHPAFVPIYDCGHHAGTGSAYLVMDHLPGESLARRLRRVGKLPPATAVGLARQIAAGLAVAHAAGIIHRDLKPGNVFLVPDGQGEAVRILDFGVAKLRPLAGPATLQTGPGVVLGTPRYMAPEQARGAPVIDGRADIYALGCVLFTMLCGRPPFDLTGIGALLSAHVHRPPPCPRGFEPSLPGALTEQILKALAKQPQARHPDMATFSAALAATMTSAPLVAPSTLALALAPTEPASTISDRVAMSEPEPATLSDAAATTLTHVARGLSRKTRAAIAAALLTAGSAALAQAVAPPGPASADATAPASHPFAPPLSLVAARSAEWHPLPPRRAPAPPSAVTQTPSTTAPRRPPRRAPRRQPTPQTALAVPILD